MSQEDISELLPSGFVIDDKFEVVSLIGSGGNSDVYKARHRLLDSFVAIKVIHKNLLTSEKAITRFQREAATLSTLQHENIVRCLGFGQLNDGRFYMVQELVPGQTLDKILSKEKTIEPARALNIIRNVCRGLRTAHQNNIVHRDIKPANIAVFTAEDGEQAKILDFGIYKNTDLQKEQALTATGQILGTYSYASPEQCSNKAINASSDIYSLACVFYEMLCGAAPFEGETELITLNNHVYKEIDKIPAVKPIAPDLQKLILRCLKKKPDERFQNAEELDFSLRQIDLSKSGGRKALFFACFITVTMLAIYTVIHNYQQEKANLTAEFVDKTALKFASSRRSIPPPIVDSRELTIEQQDEWLNAQIQKCKLDAALDAWCASAGARSLLFITKLPPHAEEIEKRCDEKLTSLNTAHSSQEDLLNFLERYIRFLSYSKKYKKAQVLLDNIHVKPGDNQYVRKKLNCFIYMAQLGGPVDIKKLLKERISLVDDVPLVAWDDYYSLSVLARNEGNTKERIKLLKKAMSCCRPTRLKDGVELTAKALCTGLELAESEFSEGNKTEGRKALHFFESHVPEEYKKKLKIYNIEVDALKNADESDWKIFVDSARKADCDQVKPAASVLAKYAFFLEEKNQTNSAYQQLKEAELLHKKCGHKDSTKKKPEEKLEWLSKVNNRQIQYGEIEFTIALSLDKLGQPDKAKRVLKEVLANPALQPSTRMAAEDLKVCFDHKTDPAAALIEHKKLWNDSTRDSKFANNQQALLSHIVEDYVRQNRFDEARQFLIANRSLIQLPVVRSNVDKVVEILQAPPDIRAQAINSWLQKKH